MTTQTSATLFLQQHNATFTTCHYDYAPQKGHIGEQAAHAIGAHPDAVFKTLAAKIDRKQPVFAVIPVNKRVNFKALAASLNGRNAKMMQPSEAHERTGFVSGGTTPFGSRQTFPVVIDHSALSHSEIWINAGAQGFLACLSPQEIQRVTNAIFENISDE
ncbi:Cys-tRNA(Pro) deacylase [Saccharibacter sp. 17.LH.SD]|uniref:aminoacyl-tRNA deacylase n=1 Tax=Saccharibacter sp. 17.LH.SD TaxID=2689393 RepID=UPI00136BA6CC|nr:aminoacyl-tRNA deacylase [Saccharibacter sp. 17.LH.SD]MXV44951.1 Cys-tRNA(Pro) deacylase [Saccharibacter sp. 17.LH.SD]